MSTIQAKRVVLQDVMELSGTPRQVFPLLCPVLEYDWIPGWKCVMIHSDSGVAELDCMFRTDFPGEEGRVWQVSRYEPPQGIGFVSFVPGVMTIALRIGLEAVDGNRTRAEWTRVFTALSARGEELLEVYASGGRPHSMAALENYLETYLRTGRMAPAAGEPRG
ncbi:hypothetical protein [Fundidesulfovibrio agrisoli]|uniref:hypothetical protein n=1 Tax=Fundidesulfovibrio agrisoli TaxID=2922717 RepID=UPI001FAC243B|nr:hypothetical protein [Fundidesulfovibrio agrisoli]